MSIPSDPIDLAEVARRHAGLIVRAAGSKLHHYEKRTEADILVAVLACIEEAYRAGAARAERFYRAKLDPPDAG